MTKWICAEKDCSLAPCRCEMKGAFVPVYCIGLEDKNPFWKMYNTETRYEHLNKQNQKKTLPDWVKPGAWTYATSTGCYNKIVTVSNGVAVTEYDGIYYPEDFEDRLIIEARNRALDGIELRKFAGQIIVIANEAVQCGDYIYNGLMDFIEVGSNMYDADNLFDLDPNRYGVKEHRNADGEWVQ